MIDNNCAYCVEGDLVAKFGIKICELETSKVYLFKEQSHPGRCIVAHKKHVLFYIVQNYLLLPYFRFKFEIFFIDFSRICFLGRKLSEKKYSSFDDEE